MAKETKDKIIQAGRTLALFNTRTEKHASIKDYNRKVKHKKKESED